MAEENEQKLLRVELGGEKYTLRPTFECLEDIEDSTGRSSIELLSDFSLQKIKIKDVAAIIRAGIVGDQRRKGNQVTLTVKEVGQMILDEGFAQFISTACIFLSKAIMPDPNSVPSPDTKQQKKTATQIGLNSQVYGAAC